MRLENTDIRLATDVGVRDFHKITIAGLRVELFFDHHFVAIETGVIAFSRESLQIDIIEPGQIVAVKLHRSGRRTQAVNIISVESCSILESLPAAG